MHFMYGNLSSSLHAIDISFEEIPTLLFINISCAGVEVDWRTEKKSWQLHESKDEDDDAPA